MADTPDYALYKEFGGYLFDNYGDGDNGGQFFQAFPDLKEYSFDKPMIVLGNRSLNQETPLKGVLVSRPAVTVHIFGSKDDQASVEELTSMIYSYISKLDTVGEYRVVLDPRYTVNNTTLEQEDNLQLWHKTLDVTFRVN